MRRECHEKKLSRNTAQMRNTLIASGEFGDWKPETLGLDEELSRVSFCAGKSCLPS
jgi:hypothetical protein